MPGARASAIAAKMAASLPAAAAVGQQEAAIAPGDLPQNRYRDMASVSIRWPDLRGQLLQQRIWDYYMISDNQHIDFFDQAHAGPECCDTQ